MDKNFLSTDDKRTKPSTGQSSYAEDTEISLRDNGRSLRQLEKSSAQMAVTCPRRSATFFLTPYPDPGNRR